MFLAIRCLKQLAEEHGIDFLIALRVLLKDFYADNVITGDDNLEKDIELQKKLTDLLAKGQFHLRKWRTNDDHQTLSHFMEESKAEELLVINKDAPLKTLGVLWNHKEDFLQYDVKQAKTGPVTKRSVLSQIAQIYDPLGLLGPVMIVAKIMMQQLWTLNLEWDESLPQELHSKWKIYQSSWSQLNSLKIPRKIKEKSSTEIIIHGFSDASERAYGACLYAVTCDSDGNFQSHLLCAKSRVAPLKTITIAKLELNAALLLGNLYKTAKDALKDRIKLGRLWCNSNIVIQWICTCPSTLKICSKPSFSDTDSRFTRRLAACTIS
ncbi:uncharacterized protein LOC112453036 [Temnothorax curvispinosus]|uniref:Uncharacterized protein LOC112453036 n=1 Tax=Temnothorax curvispinosus TaxID=300111 RepID=A0A6J1PIY8_9HYME|nr:uncharacterized protein LOC112453036 [Temnothorax curvispinosus]